MVPTGLEELILLKWPYYSRQHRINSIPIRTPIEFFHKTRTNNFKIYEKQKDSEWS